MRAGEYLAEDEQPQRRLDGASDELGGIVA
jgi:hypothetical protein